MKEFLLGFIEFSVGFLALLTIFCVCLYGPMFLILTAVDFFR